MLPSRHISPIELDKNRPQRDAIELTWQFRMSIKFGVPSFYIFLQISDILKACPFLDWCKRSRKGPRTHTSTQHMCG